MAQICCCVAVSGSQHHSKILVVTDGSQGGNGCDMMADISQERNFYQQGLENLVATGTVWKPGGIVLQFDV